MIHEFSHTVFDIGVGYYEPSIYVDAPNPPLPPDAYNISQKIQNDMQVIWQSEKNAFASAVSTKRYQPDTYIISNWDEYFAEGAQTYFNGQSRNDVNTLTNGYKMTFLTDSMIQALTKLLNIPVSQVVTFRLYPT